MHANDRHAGNKPPISKQKQQWKCTWHHVKSRPLPCVWSTSVAHLHCQAQHGPRPIAERNPPDRSRPICQRGCNAFAKTTHGLPMPTYAQTLHCSTIISRYRKSLSIEVSLACAEPLLPAAARTPFRLATLRDLTIPPCSLLTANAESTV
jgi:hypothetical protein